MAIIYFDSICVQEENLRDTDTTTWICNQVLIAVYISSNLIEQPIFLRNSNPIALVESIADVFDGLATQRKTHKKSKILVIETSMRSKHNQHF